MDIVALTANHPLPDGQVTLLGAVDSVTGAMTRVETGGAALLVDCGIAQGREAERWRFPDAARDVDAVILTHGHNDHVGSLPVLLEGGFEGPIVGTRATLDIADMVLSDGLRLQGASDADITRFRRRFKALARSAHYDEAVTLNGLRGRFYFREAGHILGSTSVEILGESVAAHSRLLCSGDLGRPDSPILRDYETRWDPQPGFDLVVMESTYGDSEHRMGHGDVELALERIIKQALRDGGHILVPAFAIGRTQTLLYHLNTLVEAGRLPRLPVAVDSPFGLRVTELYQGARWLFDKQALDKIAHGDDPLVFDDLYAVRRGQDSVRLRDVKESMLIIAGSGMCTGGRIVGHLVDLLPLPETCVVFVGYQAEGTPGRAIQRAARRHRNGSTNGASSVRLGGEEVVVRAHIETLSGLSAHADRVELLRWLRALPNPKRVALHHGEPEAQQAFAGWAGGAAGGLG